MSVLTAMPPQRTNPYQDSDDFERYEIVDGVKVELPPMGLLSSGIAYRLSVSLYNFGEAKNLGRAYTEFLFRLPLKAERNRRPDIAFVPFSQWPRDRELPEGSAWDVLPDLAVEVVSPSDYAEETCAKLLEYFEAGVRLVWHIFPKLRLVDVYESPKRVTILTREDELDGGLVVPGFRLPLRELFIGD